MADLSRVRVGWSGTAVTGGGVSTFYTTGSGAALHAALVTFFTSIKGNFPNLKGEFVFPGGGEIIDSNTGALTGAWSGGTPTNVPWVSSTASWVHGVGARMVWNTGGYLRGRRVRGSTFLVPLNVSGYDADGNLYGAMGVADTAAGNALIATVPQLSIWSKPTTPGGTNGGATPVTSCTMPDQVSWLRSRRT